MGLDCSLFIINYFELSFSLARFLIKYCIQNIKFMKRTLLFLVATFLMLAGVSAQSSLIIKDKSGNDITGKTVDMLYAPADGYASFAVDVMNSSSTVKNVKVRKVEISLLPEVSALTMCWASCYPTFVYVVPDPIAIEPNAVCSSFEGDLTYAPGTLGTSTAKFIFFDIDNPNDSSYVVVNYILGFLGKPENVIKSISVSNAYPNPVSSTVHIDYKLPANVNNAKMQISNLLGSTVKNIELTSNEGTASISVNDLKNGVYFYSLVINNSATVTRKFVVNR